MSTHRHRARSRSRWAWRAAVVAVSCAAGALFVTSSLDAGGLDLRASSVSDLDTVVRQQRERAEDLQARVAELSGDVDALGSSVDDRTVSDVQQQVDQLERPAGFEAVHGPGLTVELSDAPEETIDRAVDSGEVTADQLVVHQQDIQAVVNALWNGGAEAMTLQDQRVVSTTGIKCVGNTVVLHGVPYAPPYVITAIGDPDELRASLRKSDYVAGYRTYVDAYDLGYEERTENDVTLPAYDGARDLRHARAGSTSAAQPERDD